MALGKVASYIKNLGKSMAYASIDVFDEEMPTVKDYRESNADAAKEIYHAITDFKGTIKKVDKYIKTSRIYEAGEYAIRNAIDDLMTGNLYNKERAGGEKEAAEAMGMGDIFNEDSVDDMFKDIDNMFNDDSFKELDVGDQATIKSIEGTSKATANTIAKATVTSAKYQSKISKINTNLLFAQQERLFGQLNSGISTMNDNVNTINKFNMDVFQKHIDNSTKFYESITKNSDKITAMMDEFLGMYREEYKVRSKASQANEKAMAQRKHNDEFEPMEFSELVGTEGAFNIAKYSQHVQNQIFKSLNDLTGQKMFGPEAKGNLLKIVGDNPLGDWIIKPVIHGLIGPGLKYSMDYFNEMLRGAFGTAMARLNTWANSYDEGTFSGFFRQKIGQIFGTADLKTGATQQLRTDKYIKEAIPFDGITKKAIVDVIPELLGDILAELNGGEHRRYNYANGSWDTLENLMFQDKSRRRGIEREATGMLDRIMYNPDKLSKIASGDYDREAVLKAYESTVKPWMKQNLGNIRDIITLATSNSTEKDDKLAAEIFGGSISTELAKSVAQQIYLNMDKRSIINTPGEFMSKISSYNRQMKNAVADEYNNDRYIANGAADTLTTNYLGKDKNGNTTLSKGRLLLDSEGRRRVNAKYGLMFELDDKGYNIFNYLQNIEANLQNINTSASGLFNNISYYLTYEAGSGSSVSEFEKYKDLLYMGSKNERETDIKNVGFKLYDLKRDIDRTENKGQDFNSIIEHTKDKKMLYRYLFDIKPKNDEHLKNLSKDQEKYKIIKSILDEDLDELSLENINAQNIDQIIKDKETRLSYLNNLSKDIFLELPNINIPYIKIKLMQDLKILRSKRHYILGTTRNSSEGSTYIETGTGVSLVHNKVVDDNEVKFKKDYEEEHLQDVLYKAAGKNVGYAEAMQKVFETMLKMNDEDANDNGEYSATHEFDNERFEKAFDKTISSLQAYGFNIDSPEGRVFVNDLIAKWKQHYQVPEWLNEDYGKENTIYSFTRGIKAKDNLKASLKAKDKEFDWDEFEKKSFQEKLTSVDDLSEKWDVVMMQVGKMVEKPAEIMANVFRDAGDSIFDFFFNDETEYVDKEGQKISGFFNLIKAKTANALDSFVTGFDKNIWIPIKEEFGLGVESLADSLGINWLTEKYGKATKNAFARLGDHVNDILFGGVIDRVKKDIAKEKADAKSTTTTTVDTSFMTEEEIAKQKAEEEKKAKNNEKDKVTDQIIELITAGKIKPDQEDDSYPIKITAKGARQINTSGLTAISKGEMIIPSELNPFYKGPTDKKAELRRENNIRKGLGKYLADQIGMNAEGNVSIADSENAPTSAEAYIAILNNLKQNNPKVYSEVMNLVNASDADPELARKRIIDILNSHKFDRTPEDQIEYNKQADLKASGTFVKRITENLQSTMHKVVLNTKNKTAINMWDNFIKNDADTVGNGIAGGTLGAVLGLLTGFGPLAGMVVGAGANIVASSETVKETLFGAKDEKGDRSGGALLSATEYKYLSKLIPDIGKFGLIGAGAGLFGIAPFGLLGGLGIGAMAAFAKNNSTFMDTIFGDVDGIIDKDKKAFLKKAFPNMALGSVATYALGPFGLLGSIILGSGMGMVATSERFKTIMLGRLVNGERSGGLLGELKNNFISPLATFAKDFTTDVSKFVYNDIIKPFAEGVGPIVRITGIAVKNTAKTLMDGVKKVIGLGPEGGILRDIWTKMITPVIKTTEKATFKVINKTKDIIKPIISFPAKMVQKTGVKANQWMLNNGYDAGMSASERLAYRKKHKFSLFGKGSNAADNDITMLGMNDNDLVDAENLARYIASNGKGTEKIFETSKSNLKENFRVLLGVSNLSGAQDKIIEDLLSPDKKVRAKAQTKVEQLMNDNHINDHKTKEIFRSTIDVMQRQKANLDQIRTGGVDKAKEQLAAMGIKGITTSSQAEKISKLFGKEVGDRGIFSKLAEVAENQTPAEKQINATEQAGDKIVDATKTAGEQVTDSVERLSEILTNFENQFLEYLKDPQAFKKKNTEFDKQLIKLEKQIKNYSKNGLDTTKLLEEKSALTNELALRKQFLEDAPEKEELALNIDVDAIMKSGDKKFISNKDRIKLRKLYRKDKKGELANKVRTIKDSHLWTDSFNTIIETTNDKLPLLRSIGKLHESYDKDNQPWSLVDALSFEETDVPVIDKLMGSTLLPTNLGWYVDHKHSLSDFSEAVDEYEKTKAAYTDPDNSPSVAFMRKAIEDARNSKNSKIASTILNSTGYQMDVERAKQEHRGIDRENTNIVETVASDGTPLKYERTTDGSLKPFDETTRDYEKQKNEAKWVDKNEPGIAKVLGKNTKFRKISTKAEISKGWSNTKFLAGKAGSLVGSVGGLIGKVLAPFLGGTGVLVAGALAGGYLLNKIPGLADLATRLLAGTVSFAIQAVTGVFTYVATHAWDIISGVTKAITEGLTGIIKVVFGTDKNDEELKAEYGIQKDETGYYTTDQFGQKKYLTEEELEKKRYRKSLRESIWENAGKQEHGTLAQIGTLAGTAYAGYKLYKWGKPKAKQTWEDITKAKDDVIDKYHDLNNTWRVLTGKSPIKYEKKTKDKDGNKDGNLTDTARLPEDVQKSIESTNKNTTALDDLTTWIKNLYNKMSGGYDNGTDYIDNIPGRDTQSSTDKETKPGSNNKKGHRRGKQAEDAKKLQNKNKKGTTTEILDKTSNVPSPKNLPTKRNTPNTQPKGPKGGSFISKIISFINDKIPIVGQYLGPKLHYIMGFVKKGLSKAVQSMGLKAAGFAIPGIGQVAMAAMGLYGFYSGFRNAASMINPSQAIEGQGKYGRGEETLEPSFIGKCICGIAGAIESITGFPADMLIQFIPQDIMYSEDKTTTINTTPIAENTPINGQGFFKQIDPKISSLRFNDKNDTKYQTIGDSGCGPIAAVNALYGTGPNPIDASNYALKNGYKEIDGGTKPEFFKSYFNKYGKSAEYTEDDNNILKNLANGNRVVLEGKSNKIDTDTPFGTGPHYVTATGLDSNGNMIIQDPQDNRENIAYNANKVLSKTKFGIAAKGKYGGEGETESETTESMVNSLQQEVMDKLLNPFGIDKADVGNLIIDKVSNKNSSTTKSNNDNAATLGTNRDAKKVNNSVHSNAIQSALEWANNRVGGPGEGNNGCTAFMKQFLSKANNPKPEWGWVPNIVQDAKLSKIWKSPTQPANPGDIAVLETNHNAGDGADHVVVATGDGNYIGNSSSRNKIWKGNLGNDFGSENVVGYVATGDTKSSGTVTTGKLQRTEKELIDDSGTSALTSRHGAGKFTHKASVDQFIHKDEAPEYKYGRGEEETYNTPKRVERVVEQTAATPTIQSKDYSEDLSKIISLLSEIAENTKGSNEISSQNRKALNQIASQTAKRLTRGNSSGAGRLSANDSLEDTEDMIDSLYKLAQR